MAPSLLIVDDEPGIQGALEALFGGEFEVILAADGVEALEWVGRVRVDAVLMDLRMPGMGGGEALRRIRERQPGLAVLMMSATAPTGELWEGMGRLADGFILKPWDVGLLWALVARAARRGRVGMGWRCLRGDEEILNPIHNYGIVHLN